VCRMTREVAHSPPNDLRRDEKPILGQRLSYGQLPSHYDIGTTTNGGDPRGCLKVQFTGSVCEATADWQTVQFLVTAGNAVTFHRDGQPMDHRTSPLEADGSKSASEEVDITGYFPGFTVLRDRPVQIRSIRIER
jgi:hypothetical protein